MLWLAKNDLGLGLISDYYHCNGQPCMTLRVYLQENGYTDAIKEKLSDFADYLRHTGLLTKNIIPHNLIIANDGHLKLIDGIGPSSPLNIARFSKHARKKYIESRIKRMYFRLEWEIGEKNLRWEDAEKAR